MLEYASMFTIIVGLVVTFILEYTSMFTTVVGLQNMSIVGHHIVVTLPVSMATANVTCSIIGEY